MSHTNLIFVKASLTIKINGMPVLKKDSESVKQKAALLSLGISTCVHHISPGYQALWQCCHATNLCILLLSNMSCLRFCSQKMPQTILDMLKEEYLR